MKIMKTNREKFLALVSEIDTKTEEKSIWRIANRQWLHVSQDIAFDILEKLDDLGWSQKDLAEKMGESPQYVHKLVKGSENLTLETLVKLQTLLDIPLLAGYFKDKQTPSTATLFAFGEEIESYKNAVSH
jgi:ribosome-binding protein aMBF1 (putative translation factor)